MTEKRFTIVNMGLDGRLIKEDGKIITLERVVDLLNENEQLKQQLQSILELTRKIEDYTHDIQVIGDVE